MKTRLTLTQSFLPNRNLYIGSEKKDRITTIWNKATIFLSQQTSQGFRGVFTPLNQKSFFWITLLFSSSVQVHAQRFVGDEFQVNANGIGRQARPAVASFPDGKFVIVWGDYTGGFRAIGQIFDRNATRLGGEFLVSAGAVSNGEVEGVTILNNENIVVVWRSLGIDGSETGIVGQILTLSGVKIGNQFLVNTFTNLSQGGSSVITLSNGNFLVTWHGPSANSSNEVYSQRFQENGSPIGGEIRVNEYSMGDQIEAQSTTLRNGDYIVTWTSTDQITDQDVFAQAYHVNGTILKREFLVNTFTLSAQNDPTLTQLSDDSILFVWESFQDGSGDGIYGQRFFPNLTKDSLEIPLNTITRGTQGEPDVAAFSDNTFFVTWRSDPTESGNDEIYGQRFHHNFTRIGPEFAINNYTNNTQERPKIATLGSTDYVIVWESTGQDGSNDGIYARLLTNSMLPPTTTSSPLTPPTPPQFLASSTMMTADLTWLWTLIGTGLGLMCLGALGYLFHKKRGISVESSSGDEEAMSAAARAPSLSPNREEGHTIIGGKYELITKITRSEADRLREETGITIAFQDGKNKAKALLGSGQFGKLRIARDYQTGSYLAVKKIKGVDNIALSKREGVLQQELSGIPHILPIFDFVESRGSDDEPVLYQFMPLAGFGNGEELTARLLFTSNTTLTEQLVVHLAQGLISGALKMHAAKIYHLDIKPSNIIFDNEGCPFLIDFGCACKLPNGLIEQHVLGDTRYFSSPRLRLSQSAWLGQSPDPIEAAMVDSWAIGLTLLEIALGRYPFDDTSLEQKFSSWNDEYFQSKFAEIDCLKAPPIGSIYEVIRDLLNPDPGKRITLESAYAKLTDFQPFENPSLQKKVFSDLSEVPSIPTTYVPRAKNENYGGIDASKQSLKSDIFQTPLGPDYGNRRVDITV